jgi:2'-5' RNA ligase
MGLPYSAATRTELQEYFLLAFPDQNVCNKIEEVQEYLANNYTQPKPAKTSIKIVIAAFYAKESMEETLIRYMHRICRQQKSFAVTLNNYGGFPPNTIYIRVQEPEAFKQLAVQLKVVDEYVQANGCPKARLVTKPQLIISSGLNAGLYRQAMLDYSQKTFHESFQLDELVLKKRSNQFDSYSQVNVFRFYPPDTNT